MVPPRQGTIRQTALPNVLASSGPMATDMRAHGTALSYLFAVVTVA
jgi:hypothetical protein